MTVDELIEAIKKSYDERIRGSKYSGSASLRVIETIAAKTGLTMSMVLLKHLDKQYPDGEIPEADLRTIVADSLEHNYSLIAEETRRAQQKILEEAEVGIKPVVPEFNRDRAEGIAKNYSETGNREEFKKNIQNHSQNIVDESIKQNARVHQSLGLEPRVTRIYDGIGVHNRKDPCAWCKARAGTNMPYSEAYAKGSFERHPGCGCEILYKVGKRIQRQSDWTHNEWEDANIVDDVIVKGRKLIGKPDIEFENNKKLLRNRCGLIPDNSLRKVDQKLLLKEIDQLEKLDKRFGAINKGGMVLKYDGRTTSLAGVAKDNSYIRLGSIHRKLVDLIESTRRTTNPLSKHHMPCKQDDDTLSKYTITHEYGHILHNMLFKQAKQNGYLNSRDYYLQECYNEIIAIAKSNNPNFDYNASISKYGALNNNRAEFFAECFANSQLGAPNDLGNAMSEWLVKKGF